MHLVCVFIIPSNGSIPIIHILSLLSIVYPLSLSLPPSLGLSFCVCCCHRVRLGASLKVAYSFDGRMFASGSSDKTIALYKLPDYGL